MNVYKYHDRGLLERPLNIIFSNESTEDNVVINIYKIDRNKNKEFYGSLTTTLDGEVNSQQSYLDVLNFKDICDHIVLETNWLDIVWFKYFEGQVYPIVEFSKEFLYEVCCIV